MMISVANGGNFGTSRIITSRFFHGYNRATVTMNGPLRPSSYLTVERACIRSASLATRVVSAFVTTRTDVRSTPHPCTRPPRK